MNLVQTSDSGGGEGIVQCSIGLAAFAPPLVNVVDYYSRSRLQLNQPANLTESKEPFCRRIAISVEDYGSIL